MKCSFVLLIATLATPALAQQSAAPANQTAAQPGSPDQPKQFCRREQQLGSIMPGKKVCHTKAEWAAIDGANNDAASNALSRRSNQLGRGS